METEIRKEYQNLPKDQHNSLKSTEHRQIEKYYIYIYIYQTPLYMEQTMTLYISLLYKHKPFNYRVYRLIAIKKKKQISEEEMVIVHGKHEESWILNLESIIRHGEGRFSVSKRTSNFVSDTQTRENPTAQSKPHGLRQIHCHFQRHSHFYL